MKKLLLPLMILAIMVIQACQGPMGPPGPEGPQGITVEADIFEVEATFVPESDFTVEGFYEDFFGTFLETDKLLIYHLWEDGGGVTQDVWRLLPQTIYLEQGQFQYNFDFTMTSFLIFLQGNMDLNLLEPEWTDNQFFRIVIIPTRATNFRIDYNNYNEVVKHYNLNENNIPKIQLK